MTTCYFYKDQVAGRVDHLIGYALNKMSEQPSDERWSTHWKEFRHLLHGLQDSLDKTDGSSPVEVLVTKLRSYVSDSTIIGYEAVFAAVRQCCINLAADIEKGKLTPTHDLEKLVAL